MSQDLLDDFFSTPVRRTDGGCGSTQFGAFAQQPPKSQEVTTAATISMFGDLLGLFDGQPPTQKPEPTHVSRLAHQEQQRPASFHGDPFAVFGNITNKPTTPSARPASVSAFDDTFSTVPRGNGNAIVVTEDDDGDDDFGDFTSAPTTGGSLVLTNPPSTARTIFSEPSRASNASPPPPPTPPKPKYIRARKVSDTDPFGDFVTPLTPASPPGLSFGSPLSPRVPSIPLKSFASIPAPSPYRRPTKAVEIPLAAVLLRAFPPLFLLPQEHLLDKLRNLSFPLRQRVLAHTRTKEFLEGICEVGRVAGRIIAGRKRLVKRSVTGKAGGGMKLGNGTNAAWEQQKEDREVKEICRLWKEGSGRLKAAMGVGVPEFDDEPLKGVNGKGGCKLCGLGKEELLPGLKERTERLGWWDRGWGGHSGCKGFWEKHGKGLTAMVR